MVCARDQEVRGTIISGSLQIATHEVMPTKKIIAPALPHSSLPPDAKQLLWYIEHTLVDEYSLLVGVDAVYENPLYTKGHWREKAEQLQLRPQGLNVP